MINKENVIDVTHWANNIFSFKTTRKFPNKFNNGEFTMIGINYNNKNIMRAYSIASANHESNLEFLSIISDTGELTARLKNIRPGDEILISSKSSGTLVVDYLLPGRNLYLISTGTGLAPFMSIIKDPQTYERFEKVILTHTTSYINQLAFKKELELFNKNWNIITKSQFYYFNTVTRENWHNSGRITNWIKEKRLSKKIKCEEIDSEKDRFMICGSLELNNDLIKYFKSINMKEGGTKKAGGFVVEKAFVKS
mgnify:CR=1 FL=1